MKNHSSKTPVCDCPKCRRPSEWVIAMWCFGLCLGLVFFAWLLGGGK